MKIQTFFFFFFFFFETKSSFFRLLNLPRLLKLLFNTFQNFQQSVNRQHKRRLDCAGVQNDPGTRCSYMTISEREREREREREKKL